jgi:hypothetical protein
VDEGILLDRTKGESPRPRRGASRCVPTTIRRSCTAVSWPGVRWHRSPPTTSCRRVAVGRRHGSDPEVSRRPGWQKRDPANARRPGVRR